MDSRKQYYIVGSAQVVAQYANDNLLGFVFGSCQIVPVKFDRENAYHLINTLDIVPVFETQLEAHLYARSLRKNRGECKIFHPTKVLLAPVIEIEVDDKNIKTHIDSHATINEKLDLGVHAEYMSFWPIGREERTVSLRKIQRQSLEIDLQHLTRIYFPDSGFPVQRFPLDNQKNQCAIC